MSPNRNQFLNDKINQLSRNINSLKNKHDLIDNPEEHINNQLQLLSLKDNLLTSHIELLENFSASLNERNIESSDEDEVLKLAKYSDDLREKINALTHEIVTIENDINKFDEPNYMEYRNLIRERDTLQTQLDNPMNTSTDAYGLQQNPDKNSRALTYVSLLKGEISKLDWRDEFYSKHNFKAINTEENNEKMQFISNDQKHSITIDNERVKLQTPMPESEHEMHAIVNTILDLYLKCIQGETVYGHVVDHENPKIKEYMEISLANKLSEMGIKYDKINAKCITEILNPNVSKQIEKNHDNGLSIPVEPQPASLRR